MEDGVAEADDFQRRLLLVVHDLLTRPLRPFELLEDVGESGIGARRPFQPLDDAFVEGRRQNAQI